MSHIIIEHSANLAELIDIQQLVDEVHRAALAGGLPALDALRTRAVARHHFRIADGDAAYGFVAVVVRMGPGRSADEKHRFLTILIDKVDEHLSVISDRHPVALSVELQEIDAEFRINRNHVRTAMAERE